MLTHVDENGKATMVDVSSKSTTFRTATAKATVRVSSEVFKMIQNNEIKKGDVLTVANIAGIQAAKQTSTLIPLCHNIFISDVSISFEMKEETNTIDIFSSAKTNSQTGIEMEAMVSVSVAALTIYDMCKGVDKSIEISSVKLLSKSGGKSGDYKREEQNG